jgi:hypothetical protein
VNAAIVNAASVNAPPDGEVPRAEPIYFGSTERPRFGWLHRPPPGVRMRAEGMVVCNPFGSEVLSAHRSLRHFAEALRLRRDR